MCNFGSEYKPKASSPPVARRPVSSCPASLRGMFSTDSRVTSVSDKKGVSKDNHVTDSLKKLSEQKGDKNKKHDIVVISGF